MNLNGSVVQGTFGSNGHPVPLSQIMRNGLDSAHGTPRVRLGFAYATAFGAGHFLQQMQDSQAWRQSKKEWIISVHHGVTEPAAVRALCGLENSMVHLHCGGNKLAQKSLLRPPFHAKITAITEGSDRLLAVWAGSANLTGAALSANASNFEAGLGIVNVGQNPSSAEMSRQLGAWWNHALASSVVATSVTIESYAGYRQCFLSKYPDLYAEAETDPVPVESIRDASALWIESGAMSGGSRNQVEFGRDLAAFFGTPKPSKRMLEIAVGTVSFDDRPLSYKVTTFGVEIWRLSLPTEDQCGLAYPGRVICLAKDHNRGANCFSLQVSDPSASLAKEWMQEALQAGHTGVTSGHRQYGFF